MSQALGAAIRPAVLLVDDEAAVREAVAYGLSDMYAVHTAATGAAACASLRAQAMAAILLDVYLQDEYGLDLVPHLRTLSSAPIVVLTGRGSEEVAMGAVWAQVDGYVKKPVGVAELRTALCRVGVRPAVPAALAVRLRQYLDQHWAAARTLAVVATELGTDAAALRSGFRVLYGCTPGAYRQSLRMRNAAHLLRTTTWGIKEIAHAIGYTSHTRFGRVFRAVHGVSPSVYRERPSGEPWSHGLRRPE